MAKNTSNSANSPAASKGKVRRSRRKLAIRIQMMPKDTNPADHIFGGVLLSLMDMAGSRVARRACESRFIKRMVTRFMDKVEFNKPVLVDDEVTCYGRVLKIGNTSVTVRVEVEVDRAGEIIPVTSCDMVFVALDENGKPTSVHEPGGCECAQS